MDYVRQPMRIEEKSFEIIDEIIKQEHPNYKFNNEFEELVIKRCIHTGADFDYLYNLKFANEFEKNIKEALRTGVTIYTDTKMALSGINKVALQKLGCEVVCLVDDEEVKRMAKEEGITRSMAAVKKALRDEKEKVFAFGNAPTAIFQLLEEDFQPKVKAVIGAPVGFVGASESKQALFESAYPCASALGRKGGSNIAAAIMNAVMYQLVER